MKKICASLLFFLLFFVGLVKSVSAEIDESISHFHSDITINQDASITITERIEYQTTERKHGIFRYIPTQYSKGGLTREVLPIDNITVTDAEGSAIPYEQTQDGAFLNLKIGWPTKTFFGSQTYLITYTVAGAVKPLEDRAELFWDITGEGWRFPIASTSASVTSPFATIQNVDCFSGSVGENDDQCVVVQHQKRADFLYPHTISYGENVTVLLALPKDSGILLPSDLEHSMSSFFDNFVLLLLPAPVVILGLWWSKKGRDIQFVSPNVFKTDKNEPTQFRPLTLRGREPFVYEPLTDLTPGEAGALLDEKVDTQDVVAEILELARKKYLRISAIEKKALFGLSTSRDYVFEELADSKVSLSPVQQYLLNELFKSDSKVSVSSLSGTFYRAMSTAEQMIEKELVKKNVYTKKPGSARALGIFMALFISAVLLILIFTFYVPISIYWPLMVVVFQLPIAITFGYNMPQKTAVGSNLWLQARGLRKTIAYGKWRQEIQEKKLFIEEVFPFAVALGVVNQLSKDMDKLDLQPPEYIRSTSALHSMNVADFTNTMSSEIGSSLSYNPSSSSRSGGSGFSSGSSGGGGGGGGGGSW